MYYADMKRWDVANGPGVRVSLFVSGCTHHCKDALIRRRGTSVMGSHLQNRQRMRFCESWKKAIITDLPCLAGSRLNMKIRKLWLRF